MPKPRLVERILIERIGYGGVGIGTLSNGKKVLVKGGLPGSVVDGRVLKRKKDYAEVQIVHIHSVDPGLVNDHSLCPHALSPYANQENKLPLQKQGCGGCKWQGVSYNQQLHLKHAMLQDTFRNQSAFGGVQLPEVLASPQEFGYRNKIEFSFGSFRVWDDQLTDSEERTGTYQDYPSVGFHQQGRFAQIVDVDQCFLISPLMHEVFVFLKQSLHASGLPFYHSKTHTGLLRHLVIRAGMHTGHVLVNCSIASAWFHDHPEDEQRRKQLITSRQEDAFLQERVSTLLITENNGLADSVFHPYVTTSLVWGEGRIFEEMHMGEQISRFQISPFSFFQTNTVGAELLMGTALGMVGNVKGAVLDLYCGSGTIGILFLKACVGSRVVGIEIVQEAIEDAKKNAHINGLSDRAHFFAGKAEQLVHHHPQVSALVDDLGLVIVDPPREGLHKHVIDFLGSLYQTKKPKLLYISCNPVTFARDIQLLTQYGWRLTALQPVDMFPQTYHVEMIGVLQ